VWLVVVFLILVSSKGVSYPSSSKGVSYPSASEILSVGGTGSGSSSSGGTRIVYINKNVTKTEYINISVPRRNNIFR